MLVCQTKRQKTFGCRTILVFKGSRSVRIKLFERWRLINVHDIIRPSMILVVSLINSGILNLAMIEVLI